VRTSVQDERQRLLDEIRRYATGLDRASQAGQLARSQLEAIAVVKAQLQQTIPSLESERKVVAPQPHPPALLSDCVTACAAGGVSIGGGGGASERRAALLRGRGANRGVGWALVVALGTCTQRNIQYAVGMASHRQVLYANRAHVAEAQHFCFG
jgi:hypothetical protein